MWLGPASVRADVTKDLCARVSAEVVAGITTIADLEAQFGKMAFVTKRQNRLYKNLFTVAPSKGYLALSVDFPIVKQFNNTFDSKATTSAVFNAYKALFFRNLEADPVLSAALLAQTDVKIRYADFKNIGLLFSHDSPEIRAHVDRLRQKTAQDYFDLTGQIPELRAFDESNKSIIRNRMSWVTYGLGANPLQASATSRLGRYHTPAKGLAPIRDFREDGVQEELREKFKDTEGHRSGVAEKIGLLLAKQPGAKEMLTYAHGDGTLPIPSERLWDVLRRVDANSAAEYLLKLKKGIRDEFRVEADELLLKELQAYYHLLDTFLPRVHERKEANIEVGDGVHGAMYVDIRGQTPRNLVRMAAEMAKVASEHDMNAVDLPEIAAMAVRRGQDQASHKFDKIRKGVRVKARESGVTSEIKVSGDEIVIPLHEGEDLQTFSTFVAKLGEAGLPARPLLVSGGSVKPTNAHISDCETIEKALRAKLKTSRALPPQLWEDLTIGIRLEPTEKGGRVTIYMAEKKGTERVAAARTLLTHWLANPDVVRTIFPEGYEPSNLIRARVHEGANVLDGVSGR